MTPNHAKNEWKDNDDKSSELSSFRALTRRESSFKMLVKRYSTFWPTTEEILAKHPSLEFLNPDFASTQRKSSRISAIFNLVATVCGGGVLTLPIAFSRAGIIPSTILMIFSAIITNFSMYILCSCARRTGGRSYGDVARKAFGAKAELFVTTLLFIFLCFVVVAYFVLVKDIWTPVLLKFFPSLSEWSIHRWSYDPAVSDVPSDVFLIGFIIISLPLLLKRDLHALRHTCYVGFVSLVILLYAIMKQCYQKNFVTNSVHFGDQKIKWWHDDLNDILYAFPIISLSFFSIYNVLSVHSALTNPTRQRVKFVLDGSVAICFILFLAVGVSGYLYAYDGTMDNILLNFPLSCHMILIGRLGYGFTLMFGLPLVFLPCREALLTIPLLITKAINGDVTSTQETVTPYDCDSTVSHSCTPRQESDNLAETKPIYINGVNFNEERPLLRKLLPPLITQSDRGVNYNEEKPLLGRFLPPLDTQTYHVMSPSYGASISKPSNYVSTSDEENDGVESGNISVLSNQSMTPSYGSAISKPSNHVFTSKKESDVAESGNTSALSTEGNSLCKPESETKEREEPNDKKSFKNQVIHVLSTLILLICGYIGAVAVPGVGVLWSICGSSMALIIGFFIPSACYLKIRSRKRLNPRSLGAWCLLLFSVVASIICTAHALTSLSLDS